MISLCWSVGAKIMIHLKRWCKDLAVGRVWAKRLDSQTWILIHQPGLRATTKRPWKRFRYNHFILFINYTIFIDFSCLIVITDVVFVFVWCTNQINSFLPNLCWLTWFLKFIFLFLTNILMHYDYCTGNLEES